MAMTGLSRLILLVVFLIAGLLCGIMFNIALGRKPFESGGLMGGLVVGFLMFAI
jgi:hypothetical protein